ncbi:MAG TPA: class I SAM-dependent methyltransferase [Candidatus Tectomicrobia bacterium]|nr:class I SAM-dependent methyltransferase [Candidatus Tectomicrobia bacterium]
MAIERVDISRCWCGSDRLTPFADQYLRCDVCGTLINSPRLPDGCFAAGDGARNFYSKDYWFDYQRERHGFPDIVQRARDDLTERCLYWLDTVLRYKCPPGRSLEIGCAHGGFVALMKMAGFDAMGLELSPWVADYAAATFDVPVRCGTLADLEIKSGSMDCVILMDVLEHLPDPKATIRTVAKVLKPDGIVVIQTPCYRGEGSDWNMMIDQEHLFLFTEESLKRLLAHEGLNHVAIRPQLFPHDVFMIGGKSLLAEAAREDVEASLLGMSDGRLLLALLDLYERFKVSTQTLTEKWHAAESDRAARLRVIEQQGQQLGALEGERNALRQQLSNVQMEKDRALQALLAISRTRAYKLLRRMRRWEWVEETLTQASPDASA